MNGPAEPATDAPPTVVVPRRTRRPNRRAATGFLIAGGAAVGLFLVVILSGSAIAVMGVYPFAMGAALLFEGWRNTRTYTPAGHLALTAHGVELCPARMAGWALAWSELHSVRIRRKGTSRILEFVLWDVDAVASRLSRGQAQAMRQRVQAGMPAIWFDDRYLEPELEELAALLSRRILAARPGPPDSDATRTAVGSDTI